MLVSGWLFTFEALQPDFSRLDSAARPRAHLVLARGDRDGQSRAQDPAGRGRRHLGGLVPARRDLLALRPALEPALGHLADLLGRTFLIVAGAFAVIVAIDVPFQIWDHRRQLRMTKEEVREELKETEGNPLIKARIRSLQREAARRRMMAEVPKADVIVTNPTHYAVALRYRDDAMRAPSVIAKGSLLLAERIVELARAARRADPARSGPGPRAVRARRGGPRHSLCAVHRGGRGAGLGLPAAARAGRRWRAARRRRSILPVPPELDPGLPSDHTDLETRSRAAARTQRTRMTGKSAAVPGAECVDAR